VAAQKKHTRARQAEARASDSGEAVRAEKVQQELADAYEKTRQELNEVLQRLREQLARLDAQAAAAHARNWIVEHPTLALLLALGAGVLAGRLIKMGLQPAPPPLTVRARRRAERLARQARKQAQRLSRQLVEQVDELGETVAERARTLRKELPEQAAELSERIRAQAETLSKMLAEQAAETATALEETARDTSKRLKHSARRGLDAAETLLGAATTAVAVATLKKLNDWMRRLR